MKKILLFIGLVILLSSSECSNVETVKNTSAYEIYVDTVNGHEYIILRAMYAGDIEHSASCECLK